MNEDEKPLADETQGEEYAEDDFADEGWDDESYEGDALPDEEEASLPPVKKKSKSNLFIIIGGVVLAVIVLYVQMGGTPPAQQQAPAIPPSAAVSGQTPQTATGGPQPADSAVPPPPPPLPEGQQASDQPGQPPGGFLKNPEMFQEVEKIRENMQFEDYVEKGTEVTAPAQPVSGQAATEQGPLTPLPSETETATALPAGEQQPVAPMPAPASADLQEGMEKINTQLSDLSARMDQIETALQSLTVPSVNPQEIESLRSAVDALSGKVDDLAKKPASQRATAKKTSSSDTPEAPAAPRKKTVSAPALSSPWVLKSAQPGRAIVSRAGDSEVFSVAVGDSLEGIGRIEGVTQENGRWIVQGTKGIIAQ